MNERRRDKVLGTVLGAAIGDAMGHPTEFLGSLEAIRAKYGPRGVEGFALYWEPKLAGGARFAPYTDDTQLAEVVARALVEARRRQEALEPTMKRIAAGIVSWAKEPLGGHRSPGGACLSGAAALARGVAWNEAGGETAGGCGSVMRAYPFGLVFAGDVARAEAWCVAHSRLTHRDPIALAGCAAMAVGVALAINDADVSTILDAMEAAAARHCTTTAAMIARAVEEARDGVSPEVTLDRLRGWAAHEAIAAAAYVFARHPDDARAAILEGANTPGDSDSIATIAGALVGARVGASGLPASWIHDVERTGELATLALAMGEAPWEPAEAHDRA
ncbi:MAG: putative ADP-ribosylglycohydrolase [Myxococcaceae bacterium]|nr:putative ADP-ribosylglycohydrolase [Myxococcaceae bacterium]